MAAHAHTHDHIDWASRIPDLRRVDELDAGAFTAIAARLTAALPRGATVVDVGSGAGGMSAALAAALATCGGGTLFLVDAVPELLAVAAETASTDSVEIRTVHADVATQALDTLVPAADLVWAASMVHHLPDQQAGVTGLASALSPGGVLAVAEGGLETQTLPWDVGIGEPGLERRLMAARDEWFGEMRASMEGAVRMPYGWTTALGKAGLADVGSFTALVDHPAPPSEQVRQFVLGRLDRLAETVEDRIGEDDRETVRRLLDPAGPDHLGHRDDLYVLGTRTVHFGLKP
ncbi:class I SAM-dependent methyltransferase [Amycolatopsis alkalitolerans]|uniref:Class I SAM-dependent methyltransferase n=1 Tax=Amycolatopsis alkalitolerans TaxID=2547244 RepID=A0A5C4LRJ1_9PSEU|nr:class I SAM-dependent methyltransferase [Amycolatopsis alkalitolerans]TNC21404.1 class I SAM-dependent methyltransferase [Amycolatopsis alkalitolerans]